MNSHHGSHVIHLSNNSFFILLVFGFLLSFWSFFFAFFILTEPNISNVFVRPMNLVILIRNFNLASLFLRWMFHLGRARYCEWWRRMDPTLLSILRAQFESSLLFLISMNEWKTEWVSRWTYFTLGTWAIKTIKFSLMNRYQIPVEIY